MSDILREVDDLMRQERLLQIWQRHGNFLIGAILTVIVAVALQQGYQAWYRASAEKNTAELMQAMNDEDALKKFAKDQKGDAGVLAQLTLAQKLVAAKKIDEAAALYLAARNDARANKDLRDLATLSWVRIVGANPNIKGEDLRAALDPLMRDEAQPFAWSARLEAAVIAAERQNDLAGALALLEPMLGNYALPATQSERAQTLAQVYRQRQASQQPNRAASE